MYRVRGENAPAYPSNTVLDEQFPQIAAAGQSGTAVSTFTNDGLEPVTGVHLGVSTPSGWSASALGASAFPAVAPGATVSARFRVTAPSTASAPILTTELSGTARYAWRDRQLGTASGPTTERIAFPVQAPWKTFTSTTDPVLYGQSGTRLGVYGDGADTYGSTEQYSAVYQPGLEHDGSTTTVEVTAQADTNEWAKSGIMVRNDVTKPGSAAGYVILVATPGDGYALQWDSDGNGQLDQNINVNQGAGTGVGSTVYPVWLRLTRSGDSYTGAYSTDGTNWTTIGTATAPGAAANQDTALFTTSHEAGLPGEADFDHFTQN
nr:NEW3 domain-containing protein [Phaeacidiphilus oryzae]